MLKVWKYKIPIDPTFKLKMPEGSQVLEINSQYEGPVMWALVRPSNPMEIRRFRCVGTGHEIDRGFDELVYLGTAKLQNESYILHLFEEVS